MEDPDFDIDRHLHRIGLPAPGGRVEGLRAAMARLQNQFTLAYQQLSDTAVYRLLTSAVGGLADNFTTASRAAVIFFEALTVAKIVALVTNFRNFKQREMIGISQPLHRHA